MGNLNATEELKIKVFSINLKKYEIEQERIHLLKKLEAITGQKYMTSPVPNPISVIDDSNPIDDVLDQIDNDYDDDDYETVNDNGNVIP